MEFKKELIHLIQIKRNSREILNLVLEEAITLYLYISLMQINSIQKSSSISLLYFSRI